VEDPHLDGEVGNGKLVTLSMPIAFICKTVPSIGMLRIAGCE
jgi:hypothetical protein